MKVGKMLLLILAALCFTFQMATAQTVEVAEDAQAPTGGTLMDALNFLNDGVLNADTLLLTTSGGQYGVENYVFLTPIAIVAAPGLAEKPQLRPRVRAYKGNELFQLRNDLTLDGIVFDGTVMNSTELDSIKRVFKVYDTENGPNNEPDFTLTNCDMRNVYLNGDPVLDVEGKFMEFDKSASTGAVLVENCTFTNFGDEVFNASNAYKSDHIVTVPHGGHFSSFTLRNSTFNNVDGSCIKLNGDADSTTVDGPVLLENLTFYFCQRRVIWTRDLLNETVRNILIVNSKLGHETFGGAEELMHVEMYGSSIAHVDTFNIEGVKSDGDTVWVAEQPFVVAGGSKNGAFRSAVLDYYSIYNYDPMFADPDNGDFTLAADSPVMTLGHDGGPLGDRNWATNKPAGNVVEIVEDAQAPTGGTLMDALNFLNDGVLTADTLLLTTSGGQYGVENYVFLTPIAIVAAPGLAEKPQLRPRVRAYKGNELFQLRNDLTLDGIVFDGTVMNSTELDSIKRVFKVYDTENGPNNEPDFTLTNCDMRNVYLNGDPVLDVEGKFMEFDKSASTGRVLVENCTFTNFGDEVFNASNAYKSDHIVTVPHGGHFSSFTLRNSTFNNVDGSAIKLNGDADSTTVDGTVLLENLTFYFCQRRVIWTRDLMNETVRNILIVNSKLGHETFGGADELMRVEMIGSSIAYVDTFNIEGVKADGDTVFIADEAFKVSGGSKNGSQISAVFDASTLFNVDPMFADPDNGDFSLASDSPVLTLAHDGGALGDRNWAPKTGTAVQDETPAIPTGFTLEQNYPNPFNPETTIRYSLPHNAQVKLQIFNILGRQVATLVDAQQSAGTHTLIWNATNVASGVYFYRLNIGSDVQTKKMMLLR
ncbi:MAG: T9SS C-terminal target domain-containing protein [Calditrichaeota bacterium]|nr:MAG: T9SS C-terminal target domain-containing protein [Calditrichota bacterium]